MWSTCLFTTITSPEKLRRPQSWRQDSAVQPHTAVWSVVKMSSCPATLIRAEEAALPAHKSKTRAHGFPRSNAWEWLQQAELPFARAPLSGAGTWAARTERLPCNQERGGRKRKVGARRAPAASPAATQALLHHGSTLQLRPSQGTQCQEPLSHCR